MLVGWFGVCRKAFLQKEMPVWRLGQLLRKEGRSNVTMLNAITERNWRTTIRPWPSIAKAWFAEAVECGEGTCRIRVTPNLLYKNTLRNNPEHILTSGAEQNYTGTTLHNYFPFFNSRQNDKMTK